MKNVIIIFSVLSVMGLGCSTSQRPSKAQVEDLFDVDRIRMTGMGTAWEFEWQTPQGQPLGAANRQLLEHALRLSLEQWELATSDWTAESELRRLEEGGLRRCQKAGPKLLRALRLSQMAHSQSEGRFDPAIGSKLWGGEFVRGSFESLVLRPDSFCFSKDPKRLSFGGIVKGAVLGEWAFVALSAGLQNFRMSAGGSSVLLGPGASRFWPEARLAGQTKGQLVSVSRSQARDKDAQSIWDPRSDSLVPVGRRSIVQCFSESTDFESLLQLGALTDAWSTVRVIDPEWVLPTYCKAMDP